MLQEETRSGGLVTTSLHPGSHRRARLAPDRPLGNVDPAVWQTISAGQPVEVPGIGGEFMHHVHADLFDFGGPISPRASPR